MHLINTIEVSPYNFSNEEYKYPNGSSADYPEEWNRYWKRCISDKNLGGLEPIKRAPIWLMLERSMMMNLLKF